MLTTDFEKIIRNIADDGKIGGVQLAVLTGEVLDTDPTYIEVMLAGKSCFAKPCMPFGSWRVPNKAWLQKYKDEVMAIVAFDHGNPAHPVYLGITPRDEQAAATNYPNTSAFKTVEFSASIDDDAKTARLSKIDGDSKDVHWVELGDKSTTIANAENTVILDWENNTFTFKNKTGQTITLGTQVVLGMGGEQRSAVLGEILVNLLTPALTNIANALTALSTDTLMVSGPSANHTAAIPVVQAAAQEITQAISQLSTILSANVKLD